jgi:diguanylate cyclase (GGDEF)-like protein/PAS domain S-box-containing protein
MALSLLLLNVAIFALAAFSLYETRIQYEQRAEVETKNLVQSLASEIRADIHTIDLSLLTIADEAERQYDTGGIDKAVFNAFIDQQLARLPKVDGLWMTDVDGKAAYGVGFAKEKAAAFAGADYYALLKDDASSGLLVSRPIVDRENGRSQLMLARRINYLDGTFAGIVYANTGSVHFMEKFSALDVGNKGVVTLFNDDFTILARHSIPAGLNQAVGARISSSVLQEAVAAGTGNATLRSVSSIDGVERVLSYRQISDTPLNLLVGVSTETYLERWKNESAIASVIFFVLLSFSLSILMYWGLRKQMLVTKKIEQANRAIDAEKEMNRIIVHSSPLAIYTRDKNGLVTAWNQACERMFGWTDDEVIGKPLPTVPAGKEDESEEFRRQILERDRTIQTEVQRRRKDGSLVDLIVTMAALRNAAGDIEGYLAIAADITERKAAEKRVEFLAHHDVLTELPNRLLVQDRFRQAAAYADRESKKVALVFFDLDQFKAINDSLGHSIGDALLIEIASRLKSVVRSIDTISRQGGDEFLIVLSNLADADLIPAILAKYKNKLQEPFYIDGNELPISMSIGVAMYPDDGIDFDTLLKKADMAMYRAKDAGRNTYRFFDEQMNVEAMDHLLVRNGLRRALERGEFMLHYEPQISLATGKIVGTEALIRWQHPEQGLVHPAKFIHIAEESGLIVPIGEWVLNEACRQAMTWKTHGLENLTMAVNLSVMQFRRGDLEKTVIQALEESGMEPSCLELELTESVLIHDVENVLGSMQELKALGVKLSIDDFGTGYSSLSYLKRLDVDKLKIDRSFVHDLANDVDDRAIVNAIIQIARNLNLTTLAEGVESAEIYGILKEMGCEECQGFYFSKPMTAEEFMDYYRSRQNDPIKLV